MIISTHRTRPRAGRADGFTLSEVIIASALSLLVMAGVLGAFVYFGRTGLAVGYYQKMEEELRRGLEIFSEDARMATSVRWTNAWNITFTVPDSDGGARTVSYVYEPEHPDAPTGDFCRVTADGNRRVLVREISSDFSFRRFKIEQPGVADNSAANDLETKQIQVSLRTLHSSVSGPAASQIAVSARYLLRNKSTTR